MSSGLTHYKYHFITILNKIFVARNVHTFPFLDNENNLSYSLLSLFFRTTESIGYRRMSVITGLLTFCNVLPLTNSLSLVQPAIIVSFLGLISGLWLQGLVLFCCTLNEYSLFSIIVAQSRFLRVLDLFFNSTSPIK